MDMLKLHWRKITFGVVCAAAIGMGVWGYLAGSDVEAQMAIPEQLTGSIRSLSASGKNMEMIRHREQELQDVKQKAEKAVARGLDLQRYSSFHEEVAADGTVRRKERAPVLSGVLPKIERQSLAFDFGKAYLAEHAKLAERLRARDIPTRDDIRAKEAELRRKQEGMKEQADQPWSLLDAATLMAETSRRGGKLERPDIIRSYPDSLAALDRAKEIRVYLDQDALGVHPLVHLDNAPTGVDIWQAQLGLWIQQDVVSVLARLNEQAAAEQRQAGRQDRDWVAYMPVKRLKKLAISGTLGRGGAQNYRGTTFAPSFTKRANNASMFVVPLQLQLVLDQRALPALLHELSRVNFFTITNVSYERVDPDPVQRPYVYGPDPVIEATIDFEGYFLREVFDKWLPDELKPVMAMPGAMDKPGDRARG